MIFENTHNGLRISKVVGNQLFTQLYMFYTKKEATKLFRQYCKERKHGIPADSGKLALMFEREWGVK